MTPRKKPLDLGDASHGRCASTPPMSPPPPPPRAEGNAREGARFRTPPPALGRPAPSGSEFSGKEAALVITSIADRVKRRTTRGSLATVHSTGSAPSSFNRTSFSLGRMKKEILPSRSRSRSRSRSSPGGTSPRGSSAADPHTRRAASRRARPFPRAPPRPRRPHASSESDPRANSPKISPPSEPFPRPLTPQTTPPSPSADGRRTAGPREVARGARRWPASSPR